MASLEKDAELVIFLHASQRALFQIAESSHVQIVVVADRSRPLRLLWEQVTLPALARAFKLDLLHSLHYTMPVFSPCPTVVTFHDMTFFLYPQLHTRSKRILFPLYIRLSARRAAALLAVSESTRRDAIRLLNLAPEKITATPLGVPPEFAPLKDPPRADAVRQKYRLPPKYILSVGLLEPRKNLPALLRAFEKAARNDPALYLVFVGRLGWMYEEIFRLVTELGLSERVCFTGYVDAEDLPVVYNLALLFAYPTLYEGFGLPVLEAMACGLPVITSRVSSIPEITADAAVLVEPGDEQALAEGLSRLLQDEPLRASLSARGRERSALFTWQRTAERTFEVYRQVLSGRKRL